MGPMREAPGTPCAPPNDSGIISDGGASKLVTILLRTYSPRHRFPALSPDKVVYYITLCGIN